MQAPAVPACANQADLRRAVLSLTSRALQRPFLGARALQQTCIAAPAPLPSEQDVGGAAAHALVSPDRLVSTCRPVAAEQAATLGDTNAHRGGSGRRAEQLVAGESSDGNGAAAAPQHVAQTESCTNARPSSSFMPSTVNAQLPRMCGESEGPEAAAAPRPSAACGAQPADDRDMLPGQASAERDAVQPHRNMQQASAKPPEHVQTQPESGAIKRPAVHLPRVQAPAPPRLTKRQRIDERVAGGAVASTGLGASEMVSGMRVWNVPIASEQSAALEVLEADARRFDEGAASALPPKPGPFL